VCRRLRIGARALKDSRRVVAPELMVMCSLRLARDLINLIFIIPGRSWLRHYATNRQVAGSIPDGGSGFFH
jgi:hypothetical protein